MPKDSHGAEQSKNQSGDLPARADRPAGSNNDAQVRTPGKPSAAEPARSDRSRSGAAPKPATDARGTGSQASARPREGDRSPHVDAAKPSAAPRPASPVKPGGEGPERRMPPAGAPPRGEIPIRRPPARATTQRRAAHTRTTKDPRPQEGIARERRRLGEGYPQRSSSGGPARGPRRHTVSDPAGRMAVELRRTWRRPSVTLQ